MIALVTVWLLQCSLALVLQLMWCPSLSCVAMDSGDYGVLVLMMLVVFYLLWVGASCKVGPSGGWLV